MTIQISLWTLLLSMAALFGAGILVGLMYAWQSWRLKWDRLDARAAVLDQQGELLDMRAASLPSTAGLDDTGFGRKLTPSDLPARDHNDPVRRFPIAANAREAYGYAAQPITAVPAPAPAELTDDATQVIRVVLWPASRFDVAAEAVGRWLVGLPALVLMPLVLVLALLDRKPEAPRPLNAPMGYRPPPAVVAVAAAPRASRSSYAAEVIERLRDERGAPETEFPRTPTTGRHRGAQDGDDPASPVALGSVAQRRHSRAAEQKYAERANRARPEDQRPRVFDTAEIVFPPVSWASIENVTIRMGGEAT